MPESLFQVYFAPSGRTVPARRDESLMALARATGLHINASCGGDGSCGTCKVRVVRGEVEGGLDSRLSRVEVAQGYRLACTARVRSDLRVEIPLSCALDHTAVDRGRAGERRRTLRELESLEGLLQGAQLDPAVFKLAVELTAPTREDALPDLDRLLGTLKRRHGIAPVSVSSRVVKGLGPTLRASGWTVTTTLVNLRRGYRLLRVEGGDTSAQSYAVAVDIGTTTLAAQLLDLGRRGASSPGGCSIGAASMYNPQLAYGEDVISRILQAMKPDGVETLQATLVQGVNQLFEQLFDEAGVSRDRVSHMVAAGNPTMTHLFLGLDPRSIREAPYVTTLSDVPVFRAQGLGLSLGDHVPVWCFPLVAAWVGGDVVAGVVASGLWQRAEITLFIDVGTNGELVLGNRDWMMTTSCSAGPAFEGAGIRCGMRAARGAIEAIRIDRETLEPCLGVIGEGKPTGICGSGLISAVAELFAVGVLAPNGRYHERPDNARVRSTAHGGREYVLAWAGDTATGAEIVLTEADVQSLIRTKAAIYAGCRVLMKAVGVGFDEIDRVIIAGGFGRSLDLDDAIRIGLLPALPTERFTFIGNGALSGARLVSASHDLFDTAQEVARRMTPVELADNPSFLEEYVAASFLPHTDFGPIEPGS
ncbi:MAG: DUF4445 domain-containing protein [Deltaproteobacteria bacterium]|nr:DUF4445 domain-containing protein [Deltaproteobacteria bacterium]